MFVIWVVKQQLNVEVYYLIKCFFWGILVYNLYVDKVYIIDKKVSEVKVELQAENYDYVFDFYNNFCSWQVKWVFWAKVYIFDKINLEKWLIVNLKVDCFLDMYIVYCYMVIVVFLGVAYDGQGLDYFILEEDEVVMGVLFFINVLGLVVDVLVYIVFVIGVVYNIKWLFIYWFIEFCQMFIGLVVLFGGLVEVEEGQFIVDVGGGYVFNICGKFNFN